MGQVQIIGARLRGTVFMNGRILNAGYYDEADGRMSRKDFQSCLNYEARQKRLPPEKRDKPPLITVEYIPVDEIKNKGEKDSNGNPAAPEYGAIDYTEKPINELRDLCKKRGIQYAKKASAETLAELLSAYDQDLLSWTATFKDGNQFAEMDEDSKLDYLEAIFGIPEGVDENSVAAERYSSDLMDAVRCYSGASHSDEVVAKLKEILDYYNL